MEIITATATAATAATATDIAAAAAWVEVLRLRFEALRVAVPEPPSLWHDQAGEYLSPQHERLADALKDLWDTPHWAYDTCSASADALAEELFPDPELRQRMLDQWND